MGVKPGFWSIREAGLPRSLQGLPNCADWQLSWEKVNLGEIFNGNADLASALVDDGPSRTLFRALIEIGGHGNNEASLSDIEQYIREQQEDGIDRTVREVQNYLTGILARANHHDYNLFKHNPNTGRWRISAKWELSTDASEQGNLQRTALSALGSTPCLAENLVERIESRGYTGLQAFSRNKDWKSRVLLAALMKEDVLSVGGRLTLPGQARSGADNSSGEARSEQTANMRSRQGRAAQNAPSNSQQSGRRTRAPAGGARAADGAESKPANSGKVASREEAPAATEPGPERPRLLPRAQPAQSADSYLKQSRLDSLPPPMPHSLRLATGGHDAEPAAAEPSAPKHDSMAAPEPQNAPTRLAEPQKARQQESGEPEADAEREEAEIIGASHFCRQGYNYDYQAKSIAFDKLRKKLQTEGREELMELMKSWKGFWQASGSNTYFKVPNGGIIRSNVHALGYLEELWSHLHPGEELPGGKPIKAKPAKARPAPGKCSKAKQTGQRSALAEMDGAAQQQSSAAFEAEAKCSVRDDCAKPPGHPGMCAKYVRKAALRKPMKEADSEVQTTTADADDSYIPQLGPAQAPANPCRAPPRRAAAAKMKSLAEIGDLSENIIEAQELSKQFRKAQHKRKVAGEAADWASERPGKRARKKTLKGSDNGSSCAPGGLGETAESPPKKKPAARRGAARAKGGKLRKIEDRPAWFRQEVVVDAEGNAEEGGAQEDTLGSLGFIGQPGPLPRNSYAAGEVPAEHVLLNRTVEQLVELPGKKYMFTAEQSEKYGELSRSCHCCMNQHISVQCQSGPECAISYCIMCAARMYEESKDKLTEEQATLFKQGWCPRCLEACTCKACLRKGRPIVPEFSKAQLDEYRRFALTWTVPLLYPAIKSWEDEEVALGDKPRTEPRGNNRVLCDQCGTGIADMYRSCGECGIDVCLRCCADQRRAIRHDKLTCHKGHKLNLARFFPTKSLALLSTALERFGGNASAPGIGSDAGVAAAGAVVKAAKGASWTSNKPLWIWQETRAKKRVIRKAKAITAGPEAQPPQAEAQALASAAQAMDIDTDVAVPAAAAAAAISDEQQQRPQHSEDETMEIDILGSASEEAMPAEDAPELATDGPKSLANSAAQPVEMANQHFPHACAHDCSAAGAEAARSGPCCPTAVPATAAQHAEQPNGLPNGGAQQAQPVPKPAQQADREGFRAHFMKKKKPAAFDDDPEPPQFLAQSNPISGRELLKGYSAADESQEEQAAPMLEAEEHVHTNSGAADAQFAAEAAFQSAAGAAAPINEASGPEPFQADAAAQPMAQPMDSSCPAGAHEPARPAKRSRTVFGARQELVAAEVEDRKAGKPCNGEMPRQGAAPETNVSQELVMEVLAKSGHTWHNKVPDTHKRLAASRPDQVQNFVYTPHASELAVDNAHRGKHIGIFQEVWREGVPIVVRGVQQGFCWAPQVMARATTEKNTKHGVDTNIEVISCPTWEVDNMKQDKFFKKYQEDNEETEMLKLKDWPPETHFSKRLPRHNQDFMAMLPMPEYTHPDGCLNMVSYLQTDDIKPDLGPKTYVAFGRVREHQGDGDSVTKMHCDLSDAVNIMCHTQGVPSHVRHGIQPSNTARDPSYGGAGAVWDIWPRNCRPKMEHFLRRHARMFQEGGCSVDAADILHPIHDQACLSSSTFFLTERHRAMLKEEEGVESWHFEQHAYEAVFIPAGCPHQVRNLKSCIKAAIDFVSPESFEHVLGLTQERRALTLHEAQVKPEEAEVPPADRRHADKLQAELILLRSIEAWTKAEAAAA